MFIFQILFLLPNSISCFIMECSMCKQMLLPKVMADVKAMNIYIKADVVAY